MIQRIIHTVKSDIEALGWVERFGGLVIPVSFELPGEAEEETIEKTLPISTYINDADCIEDKDRYHFLVPDDSKKSVVYLEQVGNTTFTPTARVGSRYRNVIEGTQNLKLTAWLNLSAIGAVDQSTTQQIKMDLWRMLDGKKYSKLPDNDQNLPIFNIRWNVTGDILKSMSIFNPYFYESQARLMLYPHDFFAFDLEVTWFMKKSCQSIFQTGTPLDCIDVNADAAAMTSFEGVPFGGLDENTLDEL